ncbi:hypothetical protein JOF56_006289 [Kibdelosporangium banguiense]|uniref:Uncharacterized protein n=1 Tax=Kibdelosporangium banguiense TaxID=1365924 RepID=A0ABS4TNF5_9PSEU|nr:hypothetical protein [Kibdelosporangium banguiense]MBP2325904.1 hypothetical protein [Kibdelosporangium banguiense]
MDIEVPGLTEAPAVLEPDSRTTRGKAKAEPVHGVVSVGLPVVQAITPELAAGDLALQAFLADTAWTFHLVHLGATFAPGEDRFGQAWLTVTLARSDGAATPPPIIWSLTPQRAQRPIEQSRSLKLGAKLGFEASAEIVKSGKREEIFVETYGLQEPACTWEFTSTTLDQVRGTQRLALVARVPAGTPVSGSVELRATLSRKRLGLFPFKVAVSGGGPLGFTL